MTKNSAMKPKIYIFAEQQNSIVMKRFVKGAALLIILGFAPVTLNAQNDEGHNFDMAKNLEIFHEVVSELDRFYVDTLNPSKTIEAGIQAMLRGIDPYTEYYPEKDMNDLKMMTTGKYAGIGAVIRQYTGRDYIYIDEPYEGMPAAKSGLKAGDEILRINGESMKGKASSYVSDHLRGDAGTKLTITVRRQGGAGFNKCRCDTQCDCTACCTILWYVAGIWLYLT